MDSRCRCGLGRLALRIVGSDHYLVCPVCGLSLGPLPRASEGAGDQAFA